MSQSAKWQSPSKTKYLNKKVPRVDGPAKVTGAAKYTFDIVLPNMLYAKVLRSPHASATVTSIDTSQAKAMPGVAIVVELGKNCRFAGDEVAVVAAETEEIARDAVRAIKVEYETKTHNVTTESGMRKASLVGEGRQQNRGDDVAGLWSKAAAVVEGEYYAPIREHVSLESHGVVAKWDGDNKLTCWVSTQAVHGCAGELANAFGIPAQNVTIICEYMGGGFGSKFSAGFEGLTAARLARDTKRPVKLMLERYEEQVGSGYGPDALLKCKAAISQDGKLLAMQAEMYGTSGNNTSWGVPFPYIYTVPNFTLNSRGVSTNTGGARALRAPGHPAASWLMETVVDELACRLGMDPMTVRQINQGSEIRTKQFALGAEKIGWANRPKTPMTGRYKRGIGCAASTWGGGGSGGSQCDVKIGNDGSVWVGIGTQDLGTGTRTYVALIVAEELGLPIERVTADIGKSTLGFSGGSGGSVTTASVAPTVKMAAVAAKARLLETAAALLGVSDLECGNGRVFSLGDSSKSVSFEQVCAKLPAGGIQERGAWNRELQQGGVAGAQFVEVEVDTWTGHIQPLRVVAVQDCGYAINRLTAESQLIGGVIQGLSMALLEHAKWDLDTGRMLNPNLETYKILGSLEVPDIDAILYDTHDKVTGIGEPACIPTAAALGNAVFNATGVRLRRLPLTPKRWFDALEETK
jgi:xanthine dehydrogenase YagR molybdenum-binding subunit